MAEKHTYKLDVTCDDPLWSQMNVYLCLVSGSNEPNTTYISQKPAVAGKTLSIKTPIPTDCISIGIYAVPTNYPTTNTIADAPGFDFSYSIYCDEEQLDEKTLNVSRWGGVQIINQTYTK